MTKEVQDLLEKTDGFMMRNNGVQTYILISNEYVLIPSQNLYFRLDDVNTALDFKCKVIAWVTGFCVHKHRYNHCYKYANLSKDYINFILGTDFSFEDIENIYRPFGNGINHDLLVKFIESGYDMKFLKEEC